MRELRTASFFIFYTQGLILHPVELHNRERVKDGPSQALGTTLGVQCVVGICWINAPRSVSLRVFERSDGLDDVISWQFTKSDARRTPETITTINNAETQPVMTYRIILCHKISKRCTRGRRKNKTYIARLVFLPPELPEPPGPPGDVELGGTVDSVALYARRVANIYPGPVETLPLLMVLLMT